MLIQIQTTPAKPETLDLTQYDVILVNTSGGKDSSVALWHVAMLAREQGVLNRVCAVQATFPEEWEGADSIAVQQCAQVGVPLTIVSRWESLLTYVRRRKMWPSSTARYCTSDFKRAPIQKYITHLPGQVKGKRQRILNVMGLRAQESAGRAKKPAFSNSKATNGKRIIDTWLPIHKLSEADVWATIRENHIPTHHAYALGFKRLSCRICIYAQRPTLLAAAWEHPQLFEEYVAVENEIGHRFQDKQSLAEVWQAKQNGERPTGPLDFKGGL